MTIPIAEEVLKTSSLSYHRNDSNSKISSLSQKLVEFNGSEGELQEKKLLTK